MRYYSTLSWRLSENICYWVYRLPRDEMKKNCSIYWLLEGISILDNTVQKLMKKMWSWSLTCQIKPRTEELREQLCWNQGYISHWQRPLVCFWTCKLFLVQLHYEKNFRWYICGIQGCIFLLFYLHQFIHSECYCEQEGKPVQSNSSVTDKTKFCVIFINISMCI